MRTRGILSFLALCLTFIITATGYRPVTRADVVIPPVWDIVVEDFEGGTLNAWEQISGNNLNLAPGGGYNGSTGLSVAVSQRESYLYQSRVALAEQGYLTFWFNPNSANIPDENDVQVPSKSLRIANVKGAASWHVLVALRVRRPAGQGYKGYLEWRADDGPHFDYESGEFDLANGWQKITLGYRVDQWVAVWVDDVLVRRISGVTHDEARGEIIEIGKSNSNSSIAPTGQLRYDDIVFQIPRLDDLWVDAVHGDDANDGLTATTALRTLQKAAERAGPGTTVHVLPGVYRETVRPTLSGSAAESVLYRAENGPGTAIIRGSEPASSLTWMQLTANTIGLPPSVDPRAIYYADLSSWGLSKPPRFVVELDSGSQAVARLPLAREPDWKATTEWKYHDSWWAADGGSSVAGCDPVTDPDPENCDRPWRSTLQLTDRTDDSDPPGVEPGNLTTLGDLTGGTIVAADTKQGHYVYRRTIVAHDVAAGRVTVNEGCEHDSGSGDPGLGWGSKYYVEGKPYLLDTPGEWWYDAGTGRLYIWPRTGGNPATTNIEISRRDNGFNLENHSYIVLDGLSVEFMNENAVYQVNYYAEKSYHNVVRNATLRYANRGVQLSQDVSTDAPADSVTDGFTLEGSEIAYMDTHAIRLSSRWENGMDLNAFSYSGVLNTVIRNNELHHLGFRSDDDNAIGIQFQYANKLRFEGNHVHHVAHNGVQFSQSIIQSSKEYGFAPHEIKTGEILVQDNVFEKACQLTTDCGALKFWGDPPDSHVFRDVLVTGNVFRDTFGWTYVSEKRGSWKGGPDSVVQGMGGFGLYVDMASGIHAYRNIAYNNAHIGFKLSGAWRDGDIVYYNNIAANSLYGFSLGGSSFDTHGSVNTQIVNNIIVGNEGYGIVHFDADGVYENLTFDHNLYYNNGWRPFEDGGLYKAGDMVIYRGADPNEYYQTLPAIQANTPWERYGLESDPHFQSYDIADHNLHDDSWPDWHLTPASVAIDQGTADLPTSLQVLLSAFDVGDPYWGTAFDIGRYEDGFAVQVIPSARAVEPGEVAHYTLSLYPSDLPHTVTLTVGAPPPNLTLCLGSSLITSQTVALLTLTNSHTGSTLLPGLWYAIPITGTSGHFTHLTSVGLLVGGTHFYLPLIVKE